MQKAIKVIKILPGLFGSDCMSISFFNVKNIMSSSLCFLGLSELHDSDLLIRDAFYKFSRYHPRECVA